MTVFIIEYRRADYKLSDCMRLDPKWGKRTFTARSEDIGTTDILAVMEAAKSPENTPEGYKLFSVQDRDANHGEFSK